MAKPNPLNFLHPIFHSKMAADSRLHPLEIKPENLDSPRRRAIQKAPQDREYVRPRLGLAACPHTLRPLRPHLLLSHLHRGGRHILAQINES
jgi:hypothetical protein